MKPSLRNKYFGWLLLLMLLMYILIGAVFMLIELNEARTEGTPFRHEIPELLALLFVMLLTTPSIFIAAWIIAGRLLHPLQEVLQTADHIRQGALNERIPALPYEDELAQLANTINAAFDRYALAVTRLEHFSADASHQLRTPLAAIRTSAQVALQAPHDSARVTETLGDIVEQTERLNRTLSQLLLLAKMEPSVRNDFDEMVLAPLLKAWTEEAQAMIDDRTVRFECSESASTRTMAVNELLLNQCFDNLFNNALAATPSGGTIEIRLSTRSDGALVWSMEDSGPGIPESDRTCIFDRFNRGSRHTSLGSGLGLAIVKEIITQHEGVVSAEQSASLGGAALVMTFPA